MTRATERRRQVSTLGRGRATLATAPTEAEEDRIRVGTGYRVRREGRTRRLDVGFSDVKPFDRPEGVEAKVASSQTGFTLKATGPRARVRLGNAIDRVRHVRPSSAYTGTGILRKRDRGRKKLKPTKKDKA